MAWATDEFDNLVEIIDRKIEQTSKSVDNALAKADELLKQRELERTLPKTGETWYVKINGNLTLSKADIIGTTANTILLRFEEALGYASHRYEKEDVKFVEKLS